MALKEKIQEELAKYLAIGLLALASFAIAAIWVLPDAWKPAKLITWLDGYATGQNLLQLLLTLAGVIAWIVYLRPWLRFDARLGIYRNMTTGTYYCTKCKAKKIMTPLQVIDRGWYCVTCPWVYNDPDHKQLPKPPTAPKRNWVRDY